MGDSYFGATGSCCGAGQQYCVCAGCWIDTARTTWGGDCGCSCVVPGQEPQPQFVWDGSVRCCGLCNPPSAPPSSEPWCAKGCECECSGEEDGADDGGPLMITRFWAGKSPGGGSGGGGGGCGCGGGGEAAATRGPAAPASPTGSA